MAGLPILIVGLASCVHGGHRRRQPHHAPWLVAACVFVGCATTSANKPEAWRSANLAQGQRLYLIATMNERGAGVPVNEDAALDLYLASCHRGHAAGCRELSRFRARVTLDRAAHRSGIISADLCDHHDPEACYDLGASLVPATAAFGMFDRACRLGSP